jgi:hypothetical protein
MYGFNHTCDSINVFHAVLVISLVPVIFLFVDFAWMLRLRNNMPPGPLPIPILGNVLQLPKVKPSYKFEEWSIKYGQIITVWIGRSPAVVFNDAWTASDLMDKAQMCIRVAQHFQSRESYVKENGTIKQCSLTVTYGDSIGSLWYSPSNVADHSTSLSALKRSKTTMNSRRTNPAC